MFSGLLIGKSLATTLMHSGLKEKEDQLKPLILDLQGMVAANILVRPTVCQGSS